MKKCLLAALFGGYAFLGIAQIGGNQVYSNTHTYNNHNAYLNGAASQSNVRSSDSLLTITTSVLLNENADSYMLTVGLNQEAKTVQECNVLINKRINNALEALSKLGISKENSYVDFVTQTKVYDYIVGENQADQIETGFEIKKNINLKFDDILLMDRIVEICAEQEIYDIINIEYLVDDINAVYERLFKEAMEISDSRKELFEEFGTKSATGKYRVVSDQFSSVFPKTQYKQYEARESSDLRVDTHYSYNKKFVRKEARKNRTFYYQGLGANGFDKVMGMSNPQIGVQHSLTLEVEYRLDMKE